jgi:hypothetical protein
VKMQDIWNLLISILIMGAVILWPKKRKIIWLYGDPKNDEIIKSGDGNGIAGRKHSSLMIWFSGCFLFLIFGIVLVRSVSYEGAPKKDLLSDSVIVMQVLKSTPEGTVKNAILYLNDYGWSLNYDATPQGAPDFYTREIETESCLNSVTDEQQLSVDFSLQQSHNRLVVRLQSFGKLHDSGFSTYRPPKDLDSELKRERWPEDFESGSKKRESDSSTAAYHFKINCFHNVVPSKDSYTARSIAVFAPLPAFALVDGEPLQPGEESPLVPLVICAATYVDRDAFHIYGGGRTTAPHCDASAQEEMESGRVFVTWRDGNQEVKRELLLVAVGALFGLSGAFLVEFLKCLPGMGS